MNEYLPPTTKAWCTEQIKQMGHPSGRVKGTEFYEHGVRVHVIIYKKLREKLHTHIGSKQSPQLTESEKPTGAWTWQQHEQNLQATDGQEVGDMDIYNEGRDVMAVDEDFPDEFQ